MLNRGRFGLFSIVALSALSLTACGGQSTGPGATSSAVQPVPYGLPPLPDPQLEHGREVWFNSTFGGEKFFSLILPNAPFNLPLGFANLITSDRNHRFDDWGVLNDPDCVQGDASTGYLDKCADPQSAGVIGIRKFPNPNYNPADPSSGPPVLVGATCAACHAGLDPSNPPADPNHPTWANIHPTVGNQFLQVGKLFGANLPENDPRWQVFHSWAPGTVDTTAIENDHINNPGIITQFFSFTERPSFNLTNNGQPIYVHRAGQGGEDDAGCEAAALRVYFNIGMCAAECMVPHLVNGPGGTQTPIDQADCAQKCPDFVQAQKDVVDMCAFMQTTQPPKLADAPSGASYIDQKVVAQGQKVFQSACASCHSNGQPLDQNVLSDDLIHRASSPTLFELGGAVATNSCRARTTNWTKGHIWAEFSSDQYKERPTGGPGYYRDVPLYGIWATAPFFHNNRLGEFNGDPSVSGRVAAYEDAMDQLLNPWKRNMLGSIQKTTVKMTIPGIPIPIPAGTPVGLFANLDPANPLHNLCPDFIENEGHYFGATLSQKQKYALTEFLKTR